MPGHTAGKYANLRMCILPRQRIVASTTNQEDKMATETTRQFIERYMEALSGSDKSPELVAQFVTDESLIRHIDEFEQAFPGYDLKVEELVAEGDMVSLRAVFSGIHQGEFQGIAATGREVSLPVMLMYRIEGNKIAQFWMSADSLSLLQQLGAVPLPV
jgi:predicted ester cyclase